MMFSFQTGVQYNGFYISVIVVISFSLIVSCQFENDDSDSSSMFESLDESSWIDPGDMFKTVKMAEKISPPQPKINAITIQGTDPELKPSISENKTSKEEIAAIYFSRYVKHLLYLLRYDEKAEEIDYNAQFRITRKQVEFLKKFAISDLKDLTAGNVMDADAILSQIITDITPVHAANNVLEDPLSNFFQSLHFKYVALGCIVMWICGNPFGAKTVGSRLFILSLVFIGIALLNTWEHMIQETEATERYKAATLTEEPIECRPHEMNTWQNFKSFWQISILNRDNPCEVYHKTIHVDPKLRVNMVKAFVEVVSDVFIHTVERIAEGLGRAITSFTKGMPWYTSMVVFPLIILGILQNLNFVAWFKALFGLFRQQPSLVRNAIEDLDNVNRQQQLPAPHPQVIYLLPQTLPCTVQTTPQLTETNAEPDEVKKCNSEVVSPKSCTVETQTEVDVGNEFEILSRDDVLTAPDEVPSQLRQRR